MPNQYNYIPLLKDTFEEFLEQPLTDNEKENEFFKFPISTLKQLSDLFEEENEFEICQLIQNALIVKNTPPVGTVMTFDEVQGIHDQAGYTEQKNQLQALLFAAKHTAEQYGIPLKNFSFIKSERGAIEVKEIQERL
ncbi:hypothetical protein ABDK00_006700 [Niabella insulamsoli]|uniref:hypothetical protein n=1 Tax=Niabella insulamsoli TaxID=3144874 RepID=UPI0031FDDBB4